MNWDGAKINGKEDDKHYHWINEAVEILKHVS